MPWSGDLGLLGRKKSFSRQKPDFSGFFRRFSEAESHDVGEFEAEIFPQALIPKGLKIICKVFRKIYTPGGYMGGGVPLPVDSEQ
jgi:hypothetical protein